MGSLTWTDWLVIAFIISLLLLQWRNNLRKERKIKEIIEIDKENDRDFEHIQELLRKGIPRRDPLYIQAMRRWIERQEKKNKRKP